jgi:hypothetical protein
MRNLPESLKRLLRPPHVLALALAVAGAPAAATGQTVIRSTRGDPGKDIRVGVYINVKQDCSSGPLPTIRLVDKPANGTVTVKSAKIKAKNYKQCLAMEVPGYVAFYKSQPTFNGIDSFSIEIKYPGGRIETQKLNVTVGKGVEERRT